jgi:hypothetical protein
MKFLTEILDELVYKKEYEGLRLIEDKMIVHGRWDITHHIVFQKLDDETFWSTWYAQPATEHQDGQDRWFDEYERDCVQVFPYTTTVTKYREFPND